MRISRKIWAAAMAAAMLVALGAAEEEELGTQHAECALFGPEREKFGKAGLAEWNQEPRNRWWRGALTAEVAGHIGGQEAVIPGGSRTDGMGNLDDLGIVDYYVFKAMQEANVAPAGPTGDYEFARRVSLDLTGRVPEYTRLLQFVNDPASDKRSRYVEELLGKSEWVDKWTMFFGDLFENTADNTQVRRYAEGRNAFYNYIKSSLAANKRYNVMATEMLASSGDSSFDKGELNWNIGGLVTGGPRTGQDNFDQMAANVAEAFLGLSHENCVLCHDGRRHLDTLSIWGTAETRRESWQLAAFFSRIVTRRVAYMGNNNIAYYDVEDNPRAADYPLNTTTGNRPPRNPIGTIRNIAPEYPFGDGGKPNAGEGYRDALARLMTNDIQFGRAIVNYVWAQFFGRGIVDPVNQFDPDRLNPAAPPPSPWTLQPSHPELLDALARDFMTNGYDLKALMRKIVNSRAYQLSARYEGEWKPDYERLYARKLVRRLWGEEIADAIIQTSNVGFAFNVQGLGRLAWAMQLPETSRLPGEPMTSFLDSFLRGNRIDEERRSDGAVTQALNLMNDSFVHQRTRATGTGAAASLARAMLTKHASAGTNSALVSELFLTVLSRPPSAEETSVATAALAQASTTTLRQQKVEDLVWSLYNKVDFIYNY